MAVLLFHIRGEIMTRGLVPASMPAGGRWLDTWLVNGDRGVPLFFVISGFILGRPFLRQHCLGGHKVVLGKYYLRRLTRLEPPYVLSLLIYTLAAVLAFPITFRRLLPNLLASMLYLHSPIYGHPSEISFVTWSLEVEVQFYIVAPLLAQLYRIPGTGLRRAVLGLLALAWGISVAANCWTSVQDRFGGLLYLQYFVAGLLLVDLLEYPRYTNRENWLWDAVSLLCWPAIFLAPRTAMTGGFLPLLIVPAYLAAFRGKASNWLFRQPWIALTGGMCYSIYLLHMLLISVSFRAIKHVHFAAVGATLSAQGLLLLVVVLLIAPFFFVLVERPCMDPNWPAKLAQAARRALGLAAAPVVPSP